MQDYMITAGYEPENAAESNASHDTTDHFQRTSNHEKSNFTCKRVRIVKLLSMPLGATTAYTNGSIPRWWQGYP